MGKRIRNLVKESVSKVRQLAPNQFVITEENGEYFQSYETVIAFRGNDGNIVLDENAWNYSKTTAKYRNQFLGMDTKAVLSKIKSGEITLANLNG